MSTFKSFDKGGRGLEDEYKGTVAVAKKFVANQGYSDDSDDVYGKTFYELQANYDITYDGDVGEKNTTTTPSGGGNYKVEYEGRRVKIEGARDKKNKNQEKVTMGLPAEGVTVNDTYLDRLLTILDNKKTDSDRSAFLLGVIIMSKCR